MNRHSYAVPPHTKFSLKYQPWFHLYLMDVFEVKDTEPEKFTKKVRRSLMKGELAKIARFEPDGPDKILITFSQFGTTKITYNIERIGEGFKATKTSEKVAMTHGMFKNEVESKLADLLRRLGATAS